MECRYCGNKMQKGRIRSKASLLNPIAASDLVWTDEKDIGKMKRNEAKLSEENEAWYCENCKLVFSELPVKAALYDPEGT